MWIASKERPLLRKLRGRIISGGKQVTLGRGCVISDVSFSDGVTIEDYVRLTGSPRISLGKNVYINCFTMISGEIEIGDNVLISQYVNIWGRAHRFMERDRLIWDQYGTHGVTDQGYDIAPVVVKEGAWIGPHVTVFRGVTIGKGAVVGANAVVTKDLPDYAVAFGIPAKVHKFRDN
jgi:acetyltransferase-like isoleucine patch superfamily enzyme